MSAFNVLFKYSLHFHYSVY